MKNLIVLMLFVFGMSTVIVNAQQAQNDDLSSADSSNDPIIMNNDYDLSSDSEYFNERLIDRIFEAMKKKKPNFYKKSERWRVTIKSGSYHKTKYTEYWVWYYRSDTGEDEAGNFYTVYKMKFYIEKGIDSCFYPDMKLSTYNERL